MYGIYEYLNSKNIKRSIFADEQHHEWSMDKKLISKLEEIGVSRVNMKTLIRVSDYYL